MKMLGETNKVQQQEFFTPVILERLIPEDHILRKVDRILDLSWVRDRVRHLYSEDMGRPSIDPESALRLMLAGFFEGIVHDRRLMREAQVNLAIRWFAGYKVSDELPDHSSLSKLRKRWGEGLFKELFAETVRQCMKAGLVNAETVHVDATLIRADVSWESITQRHARDVVRENDAEEEGTCDKAETVKVSSTDPDASLTRSSGHDKSQPRYKQHTAVDDRSGVVLDVEVTTGRTPEASMLIEQVKRVEENTGMKPGTVTADSSYSTGRNYSGLEEMGIEAVIPARAVPKQGKCFTIERFRYDEKNGVVRCPAGKALVRAGRYDGKEWNYRSDPADCCACRFRAKCVPATQRRKSIRIVDGYSSLLRARRAWKRPPESWRGKYQRHKWLVEGRHGEAKTRHGLARAVRRGLEQVSIQVFLTAAVMNLKRLAASAFVPVTLITKGAWSILEAAQPIPIPKLILHRFLQFLRPAALQTIRTPCA
jgi:transposase